MGFIILIGMVILAFSAAVGIVLFAHMVYVWVWEKRTGRRWGYQDPDEPDPRASLTCAGCGTDLKHYPHQDYCPFDYRTNKEVVV